jgi:hypothetical protein
VTASVSFGTAPGPSVVASGLSETQFDVGPLAPNQRYYWRVDLTDGELTRIGPAWSFVTAPSGDIDLDGLVTVADAQCAFNLLVGAPSCGGTFEAQLAGGVDCFPALTARDARCIHVRALGETCDLCGDPPATYSPVLTQGVTYENEDTLVVTVNLSGVPALRSFGLAVLPTSGGELVRVSRRGRTAGWNELELSGSYLVYGYTTGTTVAVAEEQFLQLHFYLPFGAFDAFVDLPRPDWHQPR